MAAVVLWDCQRMRRAMVPPMTAAVDPTSSTGGLLTY
jgi:hypothetical protein